MGFKFSLSQLSYHILATVNASKGIGIGSFWPSQTSGKQLQTQGDQCPYILVYLTIPVGACFLGVIINSSFSFLKACGLENKLCFHLYYKLFFPFSLSH